MFIRNGSFYPDSNTSESYIALVPMFVLAFQSLYKCTLPLEYLNDIFRYLSVCLIFSIKRRGGACISNLAGGPGVNLKPAFYRSPAFIYEVFIFLSFYEVDLLSLYPGDTGKKLLTQDGEFLVICPTFTG